MSKKVSAALIGLEPVELERGGKAATELAQPREELPGTGRPGHLEGLSARDLDFDLVAFFQVKGFDDGGGKANREAIAPFRDLHGIAHMDIQCKRVYP